MKRSTKTAPVALSTSYLMGSPCMGISMTTLQSFGTSRPAATRSRLMVRRLYGSRPAAASRALVALAVVLAIGSTVASEPVGAQGAPAAAPAAGATTAAGAAAATTGITPFSVGKSGTALPPPWTAFKINDRKTLTRYELVDDGGTVVLK